MARRTSEPPRPDVPERIVDIDVSQEMRGSFLEYAYSVIYSRALPDARDGLKPVQRRILYTMSEMGLRPDRGHVKSARVVGEVMGRLHPHGDSAIYDALVRMAQDFSLRLPMVDGHGNFGSPDNGPAAYRYTEARLASAGLTMVAGIEEDVVDFASNYDGREQEPTVLPSAIPSLLVNGASGIAVGMATNMAPHNLGEVVAAARHLLAHPTASLDDLMRFVPGPDLPTGGRIIGLEGIRDAYETGRGTFRMRATTKIEQVTPRRKGIVITELPWNVGPEKVIEKIRELHNAKKIQGIADVTDLTDADHGLNVVIEVKSGFVPEALLEQLFRMTPLEESFGINNVCLVEGQPRTLGLKDLLQVFLDHRLEVVTRRSAYRKRNAEDRLHLVEGLLIAILDIDEVIAVIRTSDDAAEARGRLMTVFDLSEVQANYILDMPLRRLTRFSTLELEKEKDQLNTTIAELTEILENPAKLRGVVSAELAEVAKAHGTPRRTVLLEGSGTPARKAPQMSLEVSDDPCVVMLSSTGHIARTTSGDRPPGKGPRASHDVVVAAVAATVRGEIGVVTSKGRLIRMPVLELPALPPTHDAPALAGGAPLGAFVDIPAGERVVGLSALKEDAPGLAVGTRRGVVKRVAPEVLSNKNDWEIIRLEDGDEVVGAVELATGQESLVFLSSDSQLLKFPASSVRPQGRQAGGMAGIKLSDGAEVIHFGAVADESEAVVVTVAGTSQALTAAQTSVKVSPLEEYPAKGRATGGVRSHRFLKGEDALLVGWVGEGPARAATSSGTPVDLPVIDPRRDGSGSVLSEEISAIGGAVTAGAEPSGPGHPETPEDQAPAAP